MPQVVSTQSNFFQVAYRDAAFTKVVDRVVSLSHGLINSYPISVRFLPFGQNETERTNFRNFFGDPHENFQRGILSCL